MRAVFRTLLAAALAGCSLAAAAQAYPARTITLIVSFPPGQAPT